jgi:hypothetical protein
MGLKSEVLVVVRVLWLADVMLCTGGKDRRGQFGMSASESAPRPIIG